MKRLHNNFVYAIIRIDSKDFKHLEKAIQKKGYDNIRVIIPTISILDRGYNKPNNYSEIPLLMNYGFLKIPREFLFNRDFVNEFPKGLRGMVSWLKDTIPLFNTKPKKRVDSTEIFDDFSRIATTSRKSIRVLQRLAVKNKIYTCEDITSLQINSLVKLKGYPYEGIFATVLDVKPHSKEVKVKINSDMVTLDIYIHFDNLFYTPYEDDERLLLDNPSIFHHIDQ